jgi:hypothetical protein
VAARKAAAKKAEGETFAFEPKLERFMGMYGVTIPARISKVVGRAAVPVAVHVGDAPEVRATMMPVGGGRHRLLLNRETRELAGLQPGKRFALRIRVDRRPREVPVPPDLADALREDGVYADWEDLPPGKREHILRWIEQAAHEDTRAKRIERAVVEAHARREKRIDRGL